MKDRHGHFDHRDQVILMILKSLHMPAIIMNAGAIGFFVCSGRKIAAAKRVCFKMFVVSPAVIHTHKRLQTLAALLVVQRQRKLHGFIIGTVLQPRHSVGDLATVILIDALDTPPW